MNTKAHRTARQAAIDAIVSRITSARLVIRRPQQGKGPLIDPELDQLVMSCMDRDQRQREIGVGYETTRSDAVPYTREGASWGPLNIGPGATVFAIRLYDINGKLLVESRDIAGATDGWTIANWHLTRE